MSTFQIMTQGDLYTFVGTVKERDETRIVFQYRPGSSSCESEGQETRLGCDFDGQRVATLLVHERRLFVDGFETSPVLEWREPVLGTPARDVSHRDEWNRRNVAALSVSTTGGKRMRSVA